MNKLSEIINSKLASPAWILAFVILFTIAYFIFAHEGFYWIDDYGYAKYAWEVLNGTFSITQNTEAHPNNPLTHRVLTFGPVAIFFWLFGINIYAATLWPLVCTLGTSVLLFWLFRKENSRIAIISTVLLGLYFHTLFLGSYLYSDNLIMFFAFWATAVLYRYRFQVPEKSTVGYAFLFVLINFAAYLTKETILYYGPFYLWVFVTDLFRKKSLRFWYYAAGFGILVLGLNFMYYHFRTGDWLFRFHLYEQSNVNYQTEGEETIQVTNLFQRLTYLPLYFFAGSGIMVPFVLAFGIFRKTSFRNLLLLNSRPGFWFMLALITLLQLWFSSTAYGFYKPLPLLPRFFTVLMSPLCICAAFGLEWFWKNDRKLAAFYFLAFLAVCLIDRTNTLVMYALLTAYFGWNLWQMHRAGKQPVFTIGVVVLIVVLCLRPLHFMQKPSLMSFQQQDKIIKTHLDKPVGNYLVIGDPWLHFMYDFHYRFEPNPNYTYQKYDDKIEAPEKYQAQYLLVNRSSLSNPDMIKLHPVQETHINALFPAKKLIAQEGNVLLYQLEK